MLPPFLIIKYPFITETEQYSSLETETRIWVISVLKSALGKQCLGPVYDFTGLVKACSGPAKGCTGLVKECTGPVEEWSTWLHWSFRTGTLRNRNELLFCLFSDHFSSEGLAVSQKTDGPEGTSVQKNCFRKNLLRGRGYSRFGFSNPHNSHALRPTVMCFPGKIGLWTFFGMSKRQVVLVKNCPTGGAKK